MSVSERELDWASIDRYLAGEGDSAERAAFERRLEESPAERAVVARLRGLAAAEAVVARKAAVWERVRRETVGVTVTPVPTPRTSSSRFTIQPRAAARSRWLTALRIAAAIALVVGGALAVRAVLAGRAGAGSEVAIRTVTTLAGQRASLTLSDGSRVILGPASTLRHAQTFGRDAREVTLEGEAYFEVEHDARRPFIVRAGDVVAEDLGTEFIVRAYPEDAGAQVVVREGQVALTSREGSSGAGVLNPGYLGKLSPTGQLIVERADTAAWFAWTQGWLVFDGVPLREALPRLSRWFDLDFRLADSAIGDVALVATIRNQPTDDALDVIATALRLRQVREGRVVTFYRDPDPGAPRR